MDVVITLTGGEFVTEVTAYCEDFSLELQLLPGRYLVESTLEGARKRGATTVSDRVLVYASETGASDIDFPADCFY